MTHEFKTPISTIALSSDVLMRDDISKPPERLNTMPPHYQRRKTTTETPVESVLQVSQIDSAKIA